MSTPELNKWFADTFGVDPSQLASRLETAAAAAQATPAPNRSVDPDTEPNQSIETDEAWLNQSAPPPEAPPEKKARAVKGAVAFSKALHEFEGPSVPVLGGGLKLKFKASLAVSGSIETVAPEAGQTTKLTALKVDGNKLGFEVARTWNDTEGVRVFGWNSFFVECEAALATEIHEGISVALKLSGKLACGAALEMEAVLVKVNEESHVEAFAVKGSAKLPPFPFMPPAAGLGLGPMVRLVDVKVEPTVLVEMEPNWPWLWAELGKRLARNAAVDVAAEKGAEAAVGSAGVDLAIASGFLVIAAASIAASLAAIEHAGDAARTPKQCAEMTQVLLHGYRRGVLGGDAPGGALMLVGYEEGAKAHEQAVGKLRNRFPDITDEQVEQVLATVVDRLTAEAAPAIEQMAKVKVWQAFFETHQDGFWSGSQAYDRQVAWGGIFGRAPNNEPLFLTGKA